MRKKRIVTTKLLIGCFKFLFILLTALNLLSLAVKTQTSLVFVCLLAALFFCLKKMKKIKNRRYMKKNYVSPLATEVNVAAETMLAASLQISNDKTVNTSQGGQLSGGSRGSWGNLWE